jgi:hypothetical protein
VVFGKIVPALSAIDIGNLHASETASADRRHLELTLRTEMNVRHNLCTAVRARKEQRLPQQEVDDRTDPAGHDDHDQHPESGRHSTAFDIAADITHEQDVTGERRSPGVSHQQPHGQHLVFVMGQNAVEEVLYGSEYGNCQDDRPRGDQTEIILAALRPFRILVSEYCHYAAS